MLDDPKIPNKLWPQQMTELSSMHTAQECWAPVTTEIEGQLSTIEGDDNGTEEAKPGPTWP